MKWWPTRQPVVIDDPAQWRAVTDEELLKLSDLQAVFIALAELMEFLGLDDDALLEELWRRGQRGLTLAQREKR